MSYELRLFLISAMSLWVLVGCGEGTKTQQAEVVQEEKFDLEAVRDIIQEKNLQFTQAHLSMDTATINGMFTEDSRVLPPGDDAYAGMKQISALNLDWVNYGIHEFNEETIFFYGNEDMVVDEGNYRLIYGPDSTVEVGKYVNIWRNIDGEWKMGTNIWNVSIPAE